MRTGTDAAQKADLVGTYETREARQGAYIQLSSGIATGIHKIFVCMFEVTIETIATETNNEQSNSKNSCASYDVPL